MYKIELSDGTKLENIDMHGNNFVSFLPVTEDTFKNKLSPVIITSDSGKREVHEHMKLLQIVNDWHTDGAYYFILTDMLEEELK